MHVYKLFTISLLVLVSLFSVGCRRGPNEVWEDSKTAGRHVNRGFRALGGKHGDSRQVQYPDEFYCPNEMMASAPVMREPDFIPLPDQEANLIAMEDVVRQPRETPGEMGSSIPGIDSFRDPGTDPQLSVIFQNISFEYNSSLVKGEDNLRTIKKVADYLKRNPNTYIFSEGHADERGPEAYNLALGSKRSNTVRNMLIQEGVSPDNIFTISYGKERPLVFGHDEDSWNINRRVEFKIYQR